MDKKHTCCVTGHRDIPADKIQYVQMQLRQELLQAIQSGYTHLVTNQPGLLQQNTNYLFVKRFTAKEEHRRLQCGIYLAKKNPAYTRISTQNKEVNQSLDENETKDLKEFSLRLVSKLNNITDIMFAFSILMFALKKSLELSCRLFYRAICGVDLFVLNEENIINIEKATTNTICKFYKVFAQDLPFDYTGSEMGSILLIDCDTPYGSHIHEFGMVIAETINLLGELGQTAKYSFVTVNEELIHIHEITGEILKVGLPTVEANQ